MAAKQKVTKDITTGIGTLAFPHLFKSTASTNDKGETVYDAQLIIPKSQRDDVRAIMLAIKTVGEAQWGDKWKQVRNPLRDGDKEADDLTEDGSTKGEKYPERLGCYFINARTNRPVGVVDRKRIPITDAEEVYSGCKARLGLSFYSYSSNGNHGVGVGLNGVQKVGEGENLGGGGRPSVESMFDMLDDEDIDLDAESDDFDLEDEEVEEPKARRAPAKKAAARPAAKKTAARPAAKKAAAKKVVEVEEEDEDDLYDDLDDLDDLD